MALGGCGSDAGLTESTESSRSAIIGGTQTFARPEVGVLFTAEGGCTATMISGRHFVTASHCIGYKGLERGGTLQLSVPDSSGAITQLSESVDRMFAQGTTLGAADVAVGRLAQPLASGVIIPAAIATSFPPAPVTLTAVGYGCTSREAPQPGFGVKRFLEYLYDGGGHAIGCPGDSGGPTFVGTLGANGSIVRIASGYRLDSGNDIGADPIQYRQEILALTDAMERDGICYRAHVEGFGWMPAVCNGTVAGTTGQSRRLEAIQIWSARPGISICYQASVQNVGWQGEVCDGDMAGTKGQSLRLEGLRIRLASASTGESVHYRAHVQNIGWQQEFQDGQIAGTVGQSLRMEALTVQLVGGPIVDAGYPGFQQLADVDGGGVLDYCRFVGDAPNIFLSCQLGDPGGGYGNPYAVNSIRGIDQGYGNLPRSMRDVNGDGRADFCRFVGNAPNIFEACDLAMDGKFSDDQYGFRP